jgi:hypothetical protein
MGDGSTDISSTEQEMWFVRICISGEIRVRFIGSSAMATGDAESIFIALKNTVTCLGIPWSTFITKLVALGADGAAVMMGEKTQDWQQD